MEPKNLLIVITLTLKNEGIPEEQILNETESLTPGTRIEINVGNISPLSETSNWYRSDLTYVWRGEQENAKTVYVWESFHRYCHSRVLGGV